LMTIIQMSVLALVTLILGLFVVKPLLLSKVDSQNVSTPRALSDTSGPLDTEDAGSGLTPLTGEIAMGEFGMNDANLAELPAVSSEVANFDPGLASSNDPVERLRTMIGERQEETVEILRSWLEDSEEKA